MMPIDPPNALVLGRHRLPGSKPSAPRALATPAQWQAAVLTTGPVEAAGQAEGSFAVGWTDDQGKGYLAVDRFATETLCYRVQDGRLRFAARADELADEQTPVDPQAIFEYLFFHAIPSPRTVFRGVHRLPPGHYAVFDEGRLKVQPYWTPTFSTPASASYQGLKDEFIALLEEAVRRQLDDSRPACFLSGGTDSSTIAGLIGRVAGSPAESFSIGFDAAGYDEMAYARLAAKRFGTEHHEYYVTPDDLVEGIPEVARHYDQPFGNSSALPAYCCARFARQQGVSRLLAGDGGDELFGGNARYATQRIFDWYGKVPRLLRTGLLEPLLPPGAFPRVALLRKGAGYIAQARDPMPDRLRHYNLLQRLGIEQVLSADLLAQVDTGAPLQHQRAVWSSAEASTPLDRMLAYDWRYTLAESDLPKVRETTRMAGVSVGFPLLDERLLDFSMRLPTAYKLKGTQLRWFFKEALRGFLPDEIITKSKHGFGLPFGVWALRHAGLKRLTTQSLESLAGRGIVRPTFLTALMSTHLPAHPGYYGEMVWILMMLEQWLQQHAPGYTVSRAS